VEIVSNCPSGWKMTPLEANEWIVEHMFPLFPPGDIKVPDQKR
jgi:2-oxoglutarate ferredoxin oxidoreductase subunit beta